MGHPLVSGSLDKQAIVWETRDYQPQAVFTRHTTAIDALSYQSGSTAIASASQGGVVRVWQVDTLAELLRMGKKEHQHLDVDLFLSI